MTHGHNIGRPPHHQPPPPERDPIRAELRETLLHLERLQQRQFALLEPLLTAKDELMSGLSRLNAAIDNSQAVNGQLGTYIDSLRNAAGSGDADADVDAAAARLENINSSLSALVPPETPPAGAGALGGDTPANAALAQAQDKAARGAAAGEV